MDHLSKDLVYECIEFLEFLDWKEYYHLCKFINIDLRFNIYFKNNPQKLDKLDIDDICDEEKEYLEIVQFLYSAGYQFTEDAMNFASKNGHLEIVKFLHSINAPFTENAMDLASANGHLEVVKFLHSINAQFSEYAMDMASYDGHLEVVKFLYSIDAPFTEDATYWADRNRHLEVANFLYNINYHKRMKEYYNINFLFT